MFDCRIANNGFSLFGSFGFMKQRRDDIKAHPERFNSHGIILFCGLQGSGKSLTAFRLINRLYQEKNDLQIIANVGLSFADVVPYNGLQTVLDVTAEQGQRGTILFLDEIANQFPSTISKEISDDWLTITNMMRKRRLLIIGTTPVFSRLVKPFREQSPYCVYFLGLNLLIQSFQHYNDTKYLIEQVHQTFESKHKHTQIAP